MKIKGIVSVIFLEGEMILCFCLFFWNDGWGWLGMTGALVDGSRVVYLNLMVYIFKNNITNVESINRSQENKEMSNNEDRNYEFIEKYSDINKDIYNND